MKISGKISSNKNCREEKEKIFRNCFFMVAIAFLFTALPAKGGKLEK